MASEPTDLIRADHNVTCHREGASVSTRIEWGNRDGDGSVLPASWSPRETAEERARRIARDYGLPLVSRIVTTGEWLPAGSHRDARTTTRALRD